jgi:hypothetical protein
MEIKLGSYEVKTASEQVSRLAMLIWGVAGCGKTTLAATAPGKKLWLSFDDGGTDSIAGLHSQAPETSALRDEIFVVNLAHEKNNIVDKFKRDDGLGLGKLLEEHPDIETVVVDSTTRVSQMALEHMIAQGIHKSARLELPGMGSYGGRNALLLRMFVDIMNVTGRYNRNVIFISHEAEPKTNDDGHVMAITMALGGQLPSLTTQKLGEVWYMQDVKGERKIHLRPFRVYKPMKSRMFDLAPNKPSDFVWKYDINNPDPEYEIATWFRRWRENDGKKIGLPS